MTPTGLLQRDDVIINVATGLRWRVRERVGNDELYMIRMVPEGHSEWKPEERRRGYTIMTEVKYWLKHGWKFEG